MRFFDNHLIPEITDKIQEAEVYDMPLYRNQFRTEHLYSEGTGFFFKRHLRQFKKLFMLYCDTMLTDIRYVSQQKMTFLHFRQLMKDTGMEAAFRDVEDESFTEITVRLCFNQSQMFVVNPLKNPKHLYMTFEDFMEAFARIAVMAAADDDTRPCMLKVYET